MSGKPIYEELEQRVKELEIANSEHKKAAEAFQESLVRYRNLFDTSPDAISIIDEEGNFLGVEKSEIENKNLYEITSSVDEAETCIEGNKEVFEKKETVRTEEQMMNGEGEKKFLSITKSPKIDDNGKLEYVGCSARDITEQKKVNEALAVSNAQKQAILDGIQSNIAFVNSELEILWANKTAGDSVNLTPEELVQTSYRHFAVEY